MNDEMQALAFMAGANSIFYCEKLLTTPNPKANSDMQLLDRLGIIPEKRHVEEDSQEQEELLHKKLAEAKTDHLFYNAASSNNAYK
jgi:biotin synthase